MCAARGDKIIKHKHYNLEEVSTFTIDKTTVRFLMSLASNRKIELEHYDITSAFTHERIKSNNSTFVRQEPRFDGTLKHPY